MSHPTDERESLALRILWMLLFLLVWQIGEVLLGLVVLVQLICRLINGVPNDGLLAFGDSLSQYFAQIGRFGTFNTEDKPWPFAGWPTPRVPDDAPSDDGITEPAKEEPRP
jgi:hypothetical protein